MSIDQVTLSYSSGLGTKNKLLGVLGQPLQTTRIYLGHILIQRDTEAKKEDSPNCPLTEAAKQTNKQTHKHRAGGERSVRIL